MDASRRGGGALRRDGEVLVESAKLADFRELACRMPLLGPLFGVLPKIHVVVDANIALSEVVFLGDTRRDPTARTALQELIASGTVVVYAPRAIETEVWRHIPAIAAQRQVPVTRLETVWVDY